MFLGGECFAPPSLYQRECSKSFQAHFGIYVALPADSPNVTCVRPARFRPLRQAATNQIGPVEGHQTLRTQRFLRFKVDFAKRCIRKHFCAFCVARCTYLDLSGRQTCVGVRSGDHALLQFAFKSYVVSKTISKHKLKLALGHRWAPDMRRRNVCARSRF